MPILSYFNNMWYGSASGAMVVESISDSELNIKGSANPALSIQITLPAPYLKPTRLVNSPLLVECLSSATLSMRGDARMALDVRVNELTQGDVAGAVLEAKIDGVYTLKDIMRLMSAVLLGKTIITDLGGGNAVVKFRDINDTKDRVSAQMSSSERVVVTTDTI